MTVSVANIVEKAGPTLQLRYVVRGDAGKSEIAVPRIQKPGLALAGFHEQLHPNRMLIIGGTEIDYLASIDDAQVRVGVATLLSKQPACIVVTRGLKPPEELVKQCEEKSVPLLISEMTSAEYIGAVTRTLQEILAPTKTAHGVMVDVLGVGILIMGESNMGKSETALDLVVRGHRLVADDVVTLKRFNNAVIASGNDVIRHRMEIRGLGVLDVEHMFGISSVRSQKRVELVAELLSWENSSDTDRLGLEERHYDLLGLQIPFIQLPVHPGRNIAMLLEVAARNLLLQAQGFHSARDFDRELKQRMATETHELDGLE